jgi:hypothetical protein
MGATRTVRVNGRARPVENGGVTLVEAPSLDALGATARHEIDLAQRAAVKALEHALAAGSALAEAKERIGRGGWQRWLGEHGIVGGTARTYIRLAHFRDALTDTGITSISEAMRFLSAEGLMFKAQTHGPELIYEIRRLRATGLSQRGVAKELGVAPSTVRHRERDPGVGGRRRRRTGRNPDSPRNGVNAHMIEGMAIWLCDGDPGAVTDAARRRADAALRAAYTYCGPVGAP